MKLLILFSLAVLLILAGAACHREANATIEYFNRQTPETANDKVVKSDAEWQKLLTPEQYRVLRKKGTERAFSGDDGKPHGAGVYHCAACGNELFSSEAKFDSGTGWPSFSQPIAQGKVAVAADRSLGISRDEVLCHRCGGHLGHVFTDGPPPTGLRYCMNAVAMKLAPAK